MIEATEKPIPGQPDSGHIDPFFQSICGHPRDFPVHHQALNWVIFSGIMLQLLSGIENVLLGLSPTWPMFATAGALAAAYYMVRIKRRSVEPLAMVIFAVWMLLGVVGWYGNGGLAGTMPLFMLLLTAFLTVFRRPLARTAAMVLWLMEFAALAVLQISNPSSVSQYPTPMIGYIDMAFSLILVSLYLIGYIVILSYNLERRRQQAEGLLLNILPRQVAEQLQYTPHQIVAEQIAEASVLFADVTGFTPMSAGMAATDLVELLDEVFTAFDRLVDERGLEKIKTIGDCYMVAAGVPEPRRDHACILTDLAIAMQEYAAGRTFKGRALTFRIGINSGSLVAGVIGRRKFIYDLWGDTVNTASRMESTGVAGHIQVTEATRDLIQGEFQCELRGTIPVKGKGEMPVWFVNAAPA